MDNKILVTGGDGRFAKVLKNRPKPYFQEIINRDHLTPPSVLKEESCSYIGSDDVDRERYFSKKFHNLEIENIWPIAFTFLNYNTLKFC